MPRHTIYYAVECRRRGGPFVPVASATTKRSVAVDCYHNIHLGPGDGKRLVINGVAHRQLTVGARRAA